MASNSEHMYSSAEQYFSLSEEIVNSSDMHETESPIQVKGPPDGQYQPHGIQPPGIQPREYQLTEIQGLQGNAIETRSNNDTDEVVPSIPVGPPSVNFQFPITTGDILQDLRGSALTKEANVSLDESDMENEFDIEDDTGFWDETSIGDKAKHVDDVSLAVKNVMEDEASLENGTAMNCEASLAVDNGMENAANLENETGIYYEASLADDNSEEDESSAVIDTGMDDEAQRTALSLRSYMGDAYYLDGPSTDPETVEDLGLFQRPYSYITENFNKDPEEIILERGSVFNTLLHLFKQKKYRSIHLVEDKIVFKNERGVGLGPIKEAFQLFHTQGKDFLYEGDGEVVPRKSGDQYKALGRVLFHTFWFTGGFPSFICKPYIFKLLTGRDIDEECLIKSYINFLSSDDKLILLLAVNDGLHLNMSSEAKSKLFEVISHEKNIKIKRAQNIAPDYFNDSVDETNWRQFMIDLAHLELTKKPACVEVANEFNLCVDMEGFELGSVDEAKEIIENMNPSPQAIIDKLETEDPPLTDDKIAVYGYLVRFIISECKVSDIAELFLMYCTASTNLPLEPIKIYFNAASGLARAVTVNTCANLLHLPCTYKSYQEFKEEFMSILTSTESSTFTSI